MHPNPNMLSADSPPPPPDPDAAMDVQDGYDGDDNYPDGVIDHIPTSYSSPPSLDPWAYLARLGVRLHAPADPFLSDGDAVCGVAQCVYLTQEDEEVFLHPEHPEFPCPEPECPATFTLLLDFESHYATLHK